MLTITHTHEQGTIIEGTSRGDGSAVVLKTQGWRWGRSISAWYIPHSRDRLPQDGRITRTAHALEAAGFELAPLQIDRTHRSMAEVEADKIARHADRADALSERADRRAAASDAAWERHERDVHRLPEGGEPIKVGHHSEGRHRNAIARAHTSMRRSIDASDAAEEAQRRAAIAARTTATRYNPSTVANRIEKLAAEIRRQQRSITADMYDKERGYVPATERVQQIRAENLAPKLAELRDQLSYWEQVRADQVTDGTATNYSRDTVKPGDQVKIRRHWYTVARANAKSVSVKTPYSWTDRSPWHEVQDHRPASE